MIPYLLAASLDESERESLRAFVSQARSADYTNNPILHFLVWSAINGKTGSTIQDWIKSEEAGNVLEELRLAWTEVCHSPKFVFIVLSVLGFHRLMNLSEPDLHQCFKESVCEENEETEDDQVDRLLFSSLGGFVEGKIAITEFNIHQLIPPLRDAVQNECKRAERDFFAPILYSLRPKTCGKYSQLYEYFYHRLHGLNHRDGLIESEVRIRAVQE